MAKKTTYTVAVPTTHVPERVKLNVRHADNRKGSKVAKAVARFERRVASLGEDYAHGVEFRENGRMVGIVYRVFTNKRTAEQYSRKIGKTAQDVAAE